jgi:O-antigen/teichoic acid export membrane protein
VLQSWFQGVILHSRKTQAITEAVLIYLMVNIITLSLGVMWGKVIGLYIGLFSFVLSTLIQTLWLWFRSQNAISFEQNRDKLEASLPPTGITS